MSIMPSWSVIRQLRNEYPKGTRVMLVDMKDPYVSIPSGTLGTVRCVDDIGTVHVTWDNGSGLGVVYGEDKIVKV